MSVSYLLPLFAVIVHVSSVSQSPNISEHLLSTSPELGSAEQPWVPWGPFARNALHLGQDGVWEGSGRLFEGGMLKT